MAKLMGERRGERAAWTAHITGEKAPKASKYSNVWTEKYASKKEADVAMKLLALERAGQIQELQMQVPIVLVPGRDGIAGVTYIADFVFKENGERKILDAKGVRTGVYKIKKRLAFLLHNITIEEV